MAEASAQSPHASTDKNAQRIEILDNGSEKIYKDSKKGTEALCEIS